MNSLNGEVATPAALASATTAEIPPRQGDHSATLYEHIDFINAQNSLAMSVRLTYPERRQSCLPCPELVLIPEQGAHFWAAATIEFGALICTSKNPKCDICPVSEKCQLRLLSFPKSKQMRKSQEWHGINRQYRGTIVQTLRENKSLTESEI